MSDGSTAELLVTPEMAQKFAQENVRFWAKE
jgi:hypothetical protein